ncbi:hypothetical protein WJU23_16160 [Prosthecobacter sp. SYSU 5D2]|uniref:hypothetical protein n=1 Tax=Prosthecobacter sp. SYSU 5D2 TaxID=3134134 RepID=UPI0031FF032F
MIERLVQSGLVSHKEGVRLLHSTGFRRENTHVYQVSELAAGLDEGQRLSPEDWELEWAREHLEKHLNPGVDWTRAEFYSFAAGKDDDWILWSAVVVNVPNAPPWVILSIF